MDAHRNHPRAYAPTHPATFNSNCNLKPIGALAGLTGLLLSQVQRLNHWVHFRMIVQQVRDVTPHIQVRHAVALLEKILQFSY